MRIRTKRREQGDRLKTQYSGTVLSTTMRNPIMMKITMKIRFGRAFLVSRVLQNYFVPRTPILRKSRKTICRESCITSFMRRISG
jgi:hypothetical protein